MSQDRIQFNEVGYRKLSNTQLGLDDFNCSKSSFKDYLRVSALNDQVEQIGQTWIFVYKEKIIGFVTIAMAHMKKDEHEELQIDTFGNIPALLIGHLATHKDHERQGVGRYMVSWVISKAVEFSESIGCRLVMLNPERDVIDFYRKQGFTYVPHEDEDYDSMFLDIKI
ncbi:GNAT family N-acetyltransferase [Nitrosopumilus sp.]|uniref:GNAT family N-acetyltransferase n=1 Tax=Nitrosopumilus sp. TaxID=2024843 RepID=UPI00292E264D|nr:GNAT family N-acetyltransferase [Nitrosopumilus sp.]